MKTIKELKKNERIFDISTGFLNSAHVKLTDAGTCTVIWGYNEDGWEHVSITPKKKTKIPTWNDMCQLKDIFFYENEEVLQLHPKGERYVNLVDNCLHLWKPKGIDIMDTLDKAIGGK